MLPFLVCLVYSDWNFWYTSRQPNDKYNNFFYDYSGRIQNSFYWQIYVTNSIFEGCISDSRGGALSCSYYGCEVLAEFSVFSECRSASYGGAIYTCYCDCVVFCVCNNGCNTSYSGQFIFTESNTEFTNRLNYITTSSICSTPENSGYETIGLRYGKQTCTSVNVSYNHVIDHSAIYFFYGSEISNVTYCSINSNIASDSYCVYLGDSGTGIGYNVDTCNIINNNIGSGSSDNNALLTCYKQSTISNCCILGNTASVIFYNTGHLTIYHCYCNDLPIGGNDIDTNFIETSKFINGLKFTQTGKYCYTGIDQVGDLTPLPDPTPVQTPHQTPNRSPLQTPNRSPLQTPNETPIETVPRSFKRKNKQTFLQKRSKNIENNREFSIFMKLCFRVGKLVIF